METKCKSNQRPRYLRNPYRIELIVTYQCNRRCYNCDAMVRHASTEDMMTEEQVAKFVNESIEKEIKWESIRVLGGEPTLHPNIKSIIGILNDYKGKYSKDTIITIVSNGTGKHVKKILEELKKTYDVVIENSDKSSDVQPTFWPVNQAPIDMKEYNDFDFTKGCWITTMCGGALDLNGFYPCSTAAAIARITGQDFGRKLLPLENDTMDDLFQKYCQLCGHYHNWINEELEVDLIDANHIEELGIIIEKYFKGTCEKNKLYKEIISTTWKHIFEKYEVEKPTMIKY